jgi:hypothetical protein
MTNNKQQTAVLGHKTSLVAQTLDSKENKQQTAVEWQFEQLFNSFEKFNNGEYTFDEYLKKNLEIREQAKEMEKEQIMKAISAGCRDGIFYANGEQLIYESPEQYYNETYGGGNNG